MCIDAFALVYHDFSQRISWNLVHLFFQVRNLGFKLCVTPRYMLLFSSIIPISLRVNLDMAKTAYSLFIMRDKQIENTVVRSSTIPEELGRVQYLLSDKTGTLTQNGMTKILDCRLTSTDMVFKKLHLGSVSFSKDSLDEVKVHLETSYDENKKMRNSLSSGKIRASSFMTYVIRRSRSSQ